jgi:hypothetical protein
VPLITGLAAHAIRLTLARHTATRHKKDKSRPGKLISWTNSPLSVHIPGVFDTTYHFQRPQPTFTRTVALSLQQPWRR